MKNLRHSLLKFVFSAAQFLITPRKISAIFPALTTFAIWRIILEYQSVISYSPKVSPLTPIVSLFTVVLAFLACSIGSWLIQRSKARFWIPKYLLTLGVASSPMAFYLFTIQDLTILRAAESLGRMIILAAITESIAGFLIAKIQKRSAELELHQESLLIASEKLRESVADHFHDNLQTRLVTIGIRLNKIRGSLHDSSSKEMLEVIKEIETIRSAEVRDFAREISPDFRLDGLQVSLERLFARHKTVITCQIHNLESLEHVAGDSQQFSAGLYRIAEQALSNSLLHGQATKFDLVFSKLKNDLTLEITNNGSPLDRSNYSQGHGFAVIDAWVMKFGGSWNVANADGLVKITISWPA